MVLHTSRLKLFMNCLIKITHSILKKIFSDQWNELTYSGLVTKVSNIATDTLADNLCLKVIVSFLILLNSKLFFSTERVSLLKAGSNKNQSVASFYHQVAAWVQIWFSDL
jgi:hypothetical protein